MKKKLFIKTHGCQMNEYDSAKMIDLLQEKENFELAESEEQADLLILNTCSIREKAQERVFHQIGRWRKIKEKNPDLKIAIGGCVASQEGEKIIKRAPSVDIVFGPQTLHKLPDLYNEKERSDKNQIDISFPKLEKFDQRVSLNLAWKAKPVSGNKNYWQKLQMAVSKDLLFTADHNGSVVALDIQTGQQQWAVDMDLPISGGVGYGAEKVVLGTIEGQIYALNAKDGTVLWSSTVSSEVLASPSANKEMVVAQSIDNRIYALDAETGQELWQHDSGAPILSVRGNSSSIIIQNMVIAAFDNGKLIAFAITMPSFSRALKKVNGKLFPFGFLNILKAQRSNNKASLYLIGVDPNYQNKGVTAILFNDLQTMFNKRGITEVETNPELIENTSIQAFWKNYETELHKKRSTFTKEI